MYKVLFIEEQRFTEYSLNVLGYEIYWIQYMPEGTPSFKYPHYVVVMKETKNG